MLNLQISANSFYTSLLLKLKNIDLILNKYSTYLAPGNLKLLQIIFKKIFIN